MHFWFFLIIILQGKCIGEWCTICPRRERDGYYSSYSYSFLCMTILTGNLDLRVPLVIDPVHGWTRNLMFKPLNWNLDQISRQFWKLRVEVSGSGGCRPGTTSGEKKIWKGEVSEFFSHTRTSSMEKKLGNLTFPILEQWGKYFSN